VRGEEAKLIGVARSIPNTPVNATQLSGETQNQPPLPEGEGWGEGEEAKLIGVARSIPNTLVNATQLSGETQTSPLSLRERIGVRGRGQADRHGPIHPQHTYATQLSGETQNQPPLPEGEGWGEGEEAKLIGWPKPTPLNQ